jgi:Uma2 family endonuclease
MPDTVTKIPLTLEERLPLGEEFIVETDWDTFLDVLEQGAYPVQYDEGKMLSFMGYGTEEHEALIIKIGHLLTQLLEEKGYRIYGSNLALHVPGAEKLYYNADCTVIQGKSEKVSLRGNMKAVANPVLLVEVLSASTQNFDLGQKFQRYKTISSLQQVLYVDSQERRVISYRRKDDKGTWLIEEFTNATDEAPVMDVGALSVEDIYKGIEVK